MAKGINKVIIVGNLGNDPEVRHTGSGTAICSMSLATSEQWTDKQSGEKQERTEWHRVKVFGKLAEICGEYLKKGRQVYIEGSLRTDKYTDKQGVERYSTDIIASEMQMLGGNDAEAVIGRPLTPMSYAGVARRTTRRAAYAHGAYGHGYSYAPPAVATTAVVTALPAGCAQATTSGVAYYNCGATRYQPYYHGATVVYRPM